MLDKCQTTQPRLFTHRIASSVCQRCTCVSLVPSMEVLLQQPVLLRCSLAWAVMFAAAACVWCARSSQPGVARLLATLPALVAMHWCPLLFKFSSEPLAATAAAFLCVRLTSGKVVAFILGRGALTLPLSLTQFVAVLLAPFMPAEVTTDKVVLLSSSGSSSRSSSAVAAAAASGALFVDNPAQDTTALQFKGVPHLLTIWQRAAPVQRFSIDTAIGDRGAVAASLTDSPRIAAVRRRQDLAAAGGLGGFHEGGSNSSTLRSGRESSLRRRRDEAAAASGASATQVRSCASAPSTDKERHRAASSASTSNIAAGNSSNSGHNTQPANLLLNAAVCLAFLAYSCHSRAALVAVVVHLGGMWLMWRAMAVLMQAVSRPAHALGMTLAPHFINPFASTSLSDFWARRWNITQGLVLRFYVYEPIIQGRLVAMTQAEHHLLGSNTPPCSTSSPAVVAADGFASGTVPASNPSTAAAIKTACQPPAVVAEASAAPPAAAAAAASAPLIRVSASGPSSASLAPLWRRRLAAAGTFLASGLEHELFLWYLLRSWGWHWMAFFSLQGLLLALEGRVKRAFRAHGLQLLPFVSHLAVLLVLGLTADAFFWPPLLQPRMVGPLLAAVPPQLGAWLGLQ